MNTYIRDVLHFYSQEKSTKGLSQTAKSNQINTSDVLYHIRSVLKTPSDVGPAALTSTLIKTIKKMCVGAYFGKGWQLVLFTLVMEGREDAEPALVHLHLKYLQDTGRHARLSFVDF